MQGTPYIYQGEELGMTNTHFTTIEEYRDVESLNYYQILLENGKSEEEALHILSERSRDNSRTPMQWSAEKNAGFSQAEPKVVWQSEWDSYELLLENYSDGKVDGTLRPYDGINDLLTKLRAQGYMTAVVSNKVDFAVQDLVKDFFVGQFDVAIGEREGVRKKPAPDSVYEVLKEFDLKKDEVIYIGDSDVDYATAKNAGVDCILVEWGFRDRAFLESLGATVFAKKPEDILDIVE